MKSSISLVVTLLSATIVSAEPGPSDQQLEPKLDRNLTVFEGPLLPDGRIDYITAMNDVMRKGVTHEENAFRAMLPLMPLDDEEDFEADEPSPTDIMMDLLEVTPQELEGTNPLVGLYEFGQAKGLELLEIDEIETDVYELEFQHPKITVFEEWIKLQEPGLQQLVAAVNRPKYWRPLFEDLESPGSGQFALVAFSGKQRRLARMLDRRARYAIHIGDRAVFLESFLSIYRLSDHLAQNPFLIDRLVANSIDYLANELLYDVLSDHWLGADDLAAIQRFFDGRGPRRAVAEIFGFGERVYSISYFLAHAAGKDSLGRVYGETFFVKPVDSSQLDLAIEEHGVDINTGLRLIVLQSKRNSEAWKSATLAEYKRLHEQHEKISAHRREQIAKWVDEDNDGARTIKVPRSARNPASLAEAILELPGVLMGEFTGLLGPSIFSFEARNRVTETALALERYRLAEGTYPIEIKELVPKFCRELPIDPIDGNPLRYRIEADGSAVVYSINVNLKDNGGTADREDYEAVQQGDYVWHLKLPAK